MMRRQNPDYIFISKAALLWIFLLNRIVRVEHTFKFVQNKVNCPYTAVHSRYLQSTEAALKCHLPTEDSPE